MSEHNIFEIHSRMPKEVRIADVSMREGLQHEEVWVPTEAKIYYLQQMALAGVKRLDVTNLGNPRVMPQFKDAETVLKAIRSERFVKQLTKKGLNPEEIEWTAITLSEQAVDRAIDLVEKGYGPDRILMMNATDEKFHSALTGTSLESFWQTAERCIKKSQDAGLKMCGAVGTIWGSPISGPTKFEDAIEFTKRWISIGAETIEHAEHEGTATPDQVYRYYSMLLDKIPNPNFHVAHFHVTRGWGLANVFAALLAGIDYFEGCLGGTGGPPANFIDQVPIPGIGAYDERDPNAYGLVCLEDMLVMLEGMGIDTENIDINRVIELGKVMEKTLGRRLRSESILKGKVPKN